MGMHMKKRGRSQFLSPVADLEPCREACSEVAITVYKCICACAFDRVSVSIHVLKRQRPGIAENDNNNDTNKTTNKPTMQPPNIQRTQLNLTHLSPDTPHSSKVSGWSMVWFRWGCPASCGWKVRCVGVRGDAWPVLLSPCNTHHTAAGTPSVRTHNARTTHNPFTWHAPGPHALKHCAGTWARMR